MQVADVMTKDVVTVTADTTVDEIVQTLLQHNVSAVPVVDKKNAVIGLVSEGDLMRRVRDADAPRRSWWLEQFAAPENSAAEFVKMKGRHAREVMTKDVVTVPEDMPVGQVARLLEKKLIKRVPVVRDGKLVGIVSRSNLLQGLGTLPEAALAVPTPDDRTLRDTVMTAVAEVPAVTPSLMNVTVSDGVVQIWGIADSDAQEDAIRVAAENVPGVRSVEAHMGRMPYWGYGI
ncbi:CBS domain-containing protein [Actibacterium sp. MT2.3-13A]|uniref:CBS domain-containing protein n=1 Tax=Actibacterium sp. MT2.3-13A TaxID=2828332 RepID=UPI001BA7D2CC|nr:CBS domain-containing protein [Actibacterium sp. MT2.3-13A]